MKRLLATTALAAILSAPAMAQQTDEPQDQQQQGQAQEQGQTMQQGAQDGFYAGLDQGDIFAGELIGQDVYARQPEAQAAAPEEPAPEETEQTGAVQDDEQQAEQQALDEQQAEEQTTEQQATEQETAQQQQTGEQQPAGGQQQAAGAQTMTADELENMENIGQVSEVILGQDGQVKAVVVGVGGFLGVDEREVAMDMNQVDFAVDEQDPGHYYVLANTGAEQLENAPEFDRSAPEQMARADDPAATPEAEGEQDWRMGRDPLAAPEMEREGFAQAEASQISADNLLGADVYDANDESIGSVEDAVVGENDEVEYIVLDVGGFLGIGTHTVALGLDELTVLHDEGGEELRVYVDASEDQLESMPEYAGAQ